MSTLNLHTLDDSRRAVFIWVLIAAQRTEVGYYPPRRAVAVTVWLTPPIDQQTSIETRIR